MEKLYTLAEVATLLDVNKETLRIWDRKGILHAYKTPGGHRRYLQTELDRFLGKSTIGNLYEHLCTAQYMADELGIEEAGEIMKIRQSVGDKLLKEHETYFKEQEGNK